MTIQTEIRYYVISEASCTFTHNQLQPTSHGHPVFQDIPFRLDGEKYGKKLVTFVRPIGLATVSWSVFSHEGSFIPSDYRCQQITVKFGNVQRKPRAVFP